MINLIYRYIHQGDSILLYLFVLILEVIFALIKGNLNTYRKFFFLKEMAYKRKNPFPIVASLNPISTANEIIQSRFSTYCLVSASKNYSTKGLHFHPCTATSIDYFLWILKITGYQEYYLFFKSIKHIFLLTGKFN